MAPHKDYFYLVIQVGSFTTRAQIRSIELLHDNIPSQSINIPTEIWQSNQGQYLSKNDGSSEKISFIKNGKIVDHNAFNYFIKLVYRSIISYAINDEKSIISENSLNIHLSITTSSLIFDSFLKVSLQESINYFFETLDHIASITIVSGPVCLLFAYGNNSTSTSFVIDIGYEKTTLTTIVDYIPIGGASTILPIGSKSINDKLISILPELSELQIEDLKLSEIYEVLAEANKNKSNTEDLDDSIEDDEGNIDVLKIVTSNKPKEIIDKHSKNKDDEKIKKKNSDLEFNTFIDSNGEEVTVGKQRFLGTDEILSSITYTTNYLLSKIPDISKRKDLWNNIIINGPTTAIRGFKEALLENLQKEYLILEESTTNSKNPESKFRSTSVNIPTISSDQMVFSQTPTSIGFLKKPEHFQEWKEPNMNPETLKEISVGYANDLSLLGALIFVRLFHGLGNHHAVSNIGNELYVIKRADFEEKGPNLIWDITS